MAGMGCTMSGSIPVAGEAQKSGLCLGRDDDAALAEPLESAAFEPSDTVIVLTLDGVRWQDVFLGSDPTLGDAPRQSRAASVPELHAALERSGAALGAPGSGSQFEVAGRANWSLPGYNELFSGTARHHCRTNECARVKRATLADDLARNAAPEEVAVIASWGRLEKAATHQPGQFFVSSGQNVRYGEVTLPKDLRALYRAGQHVDPSPGYADYRPDRFTAAFALAYLEHYRPKFLFVGLGDTDEYAHRDDYASYLEALEQADSWFGRLLDSIEHLNESGHPTTLFVTTDHGRAQEFVDHGPGTPEASRTFLFAFGNGIRKRGVIEGCGSHTLSELAPAIRQLLGEPSTGLPEQQREPSFPSLSQALGGQGPLDWGSI
jgi:hypothetical protein